MESFVDIGFELSIMLFFALLGSLIVSRFRQSLIIGEILAGLILGPSVLGLLHYNEALQGLAYLGSVLLLFTVGMECKLHEIYTKKNIILGILSVAVPWIFGFIFGMLIGDFRTSVLIGTALTATSVAITANVLKESGHLNAEFAKTIMGAAVVDDILSLLILSTVISQFSGDFSPVQIGFKIISSILFIVIGIIIGFKINSFTHKVKDFAKHHDSPKLPLMFALFVALVYSFVAELVGLSAIVGAFIAGVAMSEQKVKSLIEGVNYLEMIFSSIFFVILGILIEVKSFVMILPLVFGLTIVALLSKLLGLYLPARKLGVSRKDSLLIGLGMVPRGEVSMIVGVIGMQAGLLSQDMYAAILLMSLITSIIVPIFMRTILHKGICLLDNLSIDFSKISPKTILNGKR